MTSFVLVTRLVIFSVQKAGIPNFPGYLEQCQMIWDATWTMEQDLDVVRLDLAKFPLNFLIPMEFILVPEVAKTV